MRVSPREGTLKPVKYPSIACVECCPLLSPSNFKGARAGGFGDCCGFPLRGVMRGAEERYTDPTQDTAIRFTHGLYFPLP